MKNHDHDVHDLLPDCGRVQAELGSYLYDELPAEARVTLEQHLTSCVACRDELATLRDTRALLARWETPASSEDPRAIARAIAATARIGEVPEAPPPRRGRLLRWTAIASGAAAAVLFTLSVMQAHVSVADGRFELGFSLPGTAASTPARVISPDQVRAIAAQEVAARAADLEQSQNELFQRCAQLNQQDLLRLSQAVDYALAQSQQANDNRLNDLGREAQLTRRALSEVVNYLPVSQTNR